MVKSTPRGNSFSAPIRSRPEAATALLALFQPAQLSKLTSVLSELGEVYLVGGMVRDALLGKPLKDFDLAISLRPETVRDELENNNFRVIETGIEHGTLTVLANDEPVEVTTFRKPSARTSSEFGETIEEDLSGRDFTINAIAFDLQRSSFLDPWNGIEDLKNGICRSVGDAHARFEEDPHRLMRYVRFGPAQGRIVDPQTEEAAKELAPSIKKISPERIREELIAILMAECAADGVRALMELGLLEPIIPELMPAVGCEQNEFHIHDVFDHTLWVLERSEPQKLLRLASLLHDVAKPVTLSTDEDGRRHFYKHETVGAETVKHVMERLKFSKSETQTVSLLVQQHMRPLDCGPSGVRRIMRDLGEHFDTWLQLKRADAPPVMPEAEFEEVYAKFLAMVEEERDRLEGPAYGRLAISGDDLLSLGYEQGPLIGEILLRCEEVVIEDPERNTREDLLEIASQYAKDDGVRSENS